MRENLPGGQQEREEVREFERLIGRIQLKEQQQQHQQQPTVVVTTVEDSGGVRRNLLYSPASRSPSPTVITASFQGGRKEDPALRILSHGIDPELERLLDSDPGLIEIKRSASFQPAPHHLSMDCAGAAGHSAWYSLPEESAARANLSAPVSGGFDNVVASPNIVERVASQALENTR